VLITAVAHGQKPEIETDKLLNDAINASPRSKRRYLRTVLRSTPDHLAIFEMISPSSLNW